MTRPRPPILPTAAEAIAQLRQSIEQLRAERDATALAINLKLRELTVARREMAVHLRSRGYSLRQLAKVFGVSPERIRQITLKPAPMSPQPKSMRTAKTKTCVDCSVVISPTSERCRPCSQARIARRIHAWHAGGGKGWPPQYWEPEQAQEQATLG